MNVNKNEASKMIEGAMRFYDNERSDATLYAAIASMEKDPEFRSKLENVSKMERGHAEFWEKFLHKRGFTPKSSKRSFFVGIVKFLRIIFGGALVSSLFELGESTAVSTYSDFLESPDLTEQERSHVKSIVIDELEHENIFSTSKQLFHVENFRDFILGMNDGLVEILGAVTGLSAVYLHNPLMVAVSGLIVGVAGALSMGIGSFISVRSQRQVNEGTKRRMELLFRVSEERAKGELLDKLVSSGIPDDIAGHVAEKICERREAVTNLLIEETQEQEWRSALYTGTAYIVGIFFPVVPYFFSGSSIMALPFSVTFAAAALSVVATMVSVISGIQIKEKILEMVATGLGAAALSYVIGYAIQNIFGIAI
jgi:VIT1/CCC1 family predicted Fe2+/Mn2+ transporter